MQSLILIAALGLAQVAPTQVPAPTQAPAEPTPAPTQAAPPTPVVVQAPAPVQTPVPKLPAAPLSFLSDQFRFTWDRTIPLSISVDGLKVNSIFFNKRTLEHRFFGHAEFGTRARVEVTNTSTVRKVPGFAVAVLDKDGRLLGVASGGTKIGSVKPGETETFDLNFSQVKERLALGDKFLLAIELRN